MRIRWDSRHSLQAQSATCAALVPCFWSSGALHLLPKPSWTCFGLPSLRGGEWPFRADCAGIDNFLPPDFEGANER